MDLVWEVLNATVSVVLLTWVLVDKFRGTRNINNNGVSYLKDSNFPRRFSVFSTITAFSNTIISISHLGFAVYEYWSRRFISYKCLSLAITWSLASLVSFYSKNREARRWPLILILWWVLSCVVDALAVSHKLFKDARAMSLPLIPSEANLVDIASFPVLLLLCLNAISTSFTRKYRNIEEPLLQKEFEHSLGDEQAFSNAGVLSRITFQWLNPLFAKGHSQKLKLHHVPAVPQSETAESASLLLEKSLRRQKLENKLLTIAIGDAIWKSLIINSVFAGANTLASYMGPPLIKNFVNFLSEKHDGSSIQYGLVLTFIFFFSKILESLTQRQWYFGAQRIGIRVRAALTVLIYNKLLSIKSATPTNGTITNMINVDVERIGDFFWYIHGVWLLPMQVMLALMILYRNLGSAPTITALVTTILVMLCNTPLARKQESFHSKIMEVKDARIKMTSETLKSIRVLKMHSWESEFLKKILQVRETEKSFLRKYLFTCSAGAFLFWASPTLVSVATIGVCILVKTPLTTSTILSAMATFRILQDPIYNLPDLISMITQTKVSVDRIQDFLREEEWKNSVNQYASKISEVAIEIEPGEYAWEMDQNLKKPTTQITQKLRIMRGQKVAVCGSVGSGKSSLLCAMIGEITRISGSEVKVYGTRSYAPQSAWIQSGTVRDNVLFGKEMDGTVYENVLEGCALNQDIKTWADGDLTEVGERGINLSGGQKQRIQLARAVYSDADVFFLDDPFSAIDVHTARHLFKKCFDLLLRHKTVVYSTHQLGFLEAADVVLVMKDGRIVQSGKYKDLVACPSSELVAQMNAHRNALNQVNPSQEYDSTSSQSFQSQTEVAEENLKDCNKTETSLQISLEEVAENGRVKWRVYSAFITSAYKGALVPVVIFCQVFFQVLQIGSNYWLSWATEEKDRVSRGHLIGIFGLLSAGSSFFMLGRVIFMTMIAVETAHHFFHQMATSVLRAPLSFFDNTPSSQILSRSSTDQSTVDTDIPYRLAGLVFALIQLLSIIILMCQVSWQVSLLFIIVIAISIWYQDYYIATARELARMVGIRKSPIIHHFSETISGASTIRCFNQVKRFYMRTMGLVDDYSRVAFHNTATMEWLSIRINFIFNVVFFFILIVLVTLPQSAIKPSLAGLIATYGLNLNVLQAWVIWNLCNVENKMITVERILQFTNIPSEAPSIIEGSRPEADWPSDGKIEVHDLHIQYDPSLPMVLKGIRCTFPGRKKIGIVGRTGSGKSTLIQALFRVVEPTRGCIFIDGIDICKIGLEDLRSNLGIIPQDPTMFQGTMRNNLDPMQQHSDHELWEVLYKCRLADIVRHDQRLLDAPVTENGENWSVGQRQLVCLARVLLMKRRILVLDEATASIDAATDNIIQKTVRQETNECTVITVAHRIPTIIDNDLVLVLDGGKVVEYDSPGQLLGDESSSFSKLVLEFSRGSIKRNR